MGTDQTKASAKKAADDDLNKQLEESFPGSDALSVTRAPADKRTSDMTSAREDRKTPKMPDPASSGK
jgi:hypothetical protein